MTGDLLEQRARTHLHNLCAGTSGRATGSDGNQRATAYVATVLSGLGFDVAAPRFGCMHWASEGVRLEADGASFTAAASPYAPGCRVTAPLAVASTVEELEKVDAAGRIVLLLGEIAAEQLTPKRFPYYETERHRRIVQALESARPAAVVAATRQDVDTAGALDPFPLIEDGDVDVPSVYMRDEEGRRLARVVGRPIMLESRAVRIPSWGTNVVARRGPRDARRVVACAHVDAKIGTPGALDDAAGVVALLVLGELLTDHEGPLQVELVALNGEDHYANPGEQAYFAANEGRLGNVALAINLDAVGYRKGDDAYSTYGCSEDLQRTIARTLDADGTLVPGDPWYQGDHAIFVMNGVPALAVTSEHVEELVATVVHTSDDTPELVDVAKLVRLAGALRVLITRLASQAA